MRRKEKEITDHGEIESILKEAAICHLGLADHNTPYVIPLNFGYENNCLYIHSAPEGKKIDIIGRNSHVCFEVAVDIELVETESVHKCSTKYRSVIGFGKASIIEDDEGKKTGLDILMKKHSHKKHEYPQNLLDKMVLIKVEIESITGKRST